MNRFIYLVHCEYEDPSRPAPAPQIDAHAISRKLTRLPAAMARHLPDWKVKVTCELHQGNPNVIQLVVTTTLDEAATDAAFVRFIRDCDPEVFGERETVRLRA